MKTEDPRKINKTKKLSGSMVTCHEQFDCCGRPGKQNIGKVLPIASFSQVEEYNFEDNGDYQVVLLKID